MVQITYQTCIDADFNSMTKGHHSQPIMWSPPLLQNILTMPWDVDRYCGKKTNLPRENMFSSLETRPKPSFPSRLFTIPLDVIEHILDRMTKKEAFRLSQTCKDLMQHPVVLRAIFHEPISLAEIEEWYHQLPDCGMNTKTMMGPPVLWGINASTGPLVRRLAVPEWISERDIHELTAHCPNLHALDFTEIFESDPDVMGWNSDQDSDGDAEEGDINLWPSMLDRCPDLFRNLRSIRLPYGCWRTVYSRLHPYWQTHTACLPKLLHVADHLQSLEITCQQEPTLDPSPETRRQASAKLLAEILDNVNRGLTTLALYDSESTIENLDNFLQPLAIFPRLETIKISLHRDLYIYQKDSQPLYDFDLIINPILSSPNRDYEHDTASVLQYLSVIKSINDRGIFSLVSSDNGENYHSVPREYYGLCQTELILGPRDDLWAPVWTWNDRLSWVEFHQHDSSVEVVDIEKCRSLFEQLNRARIPVSIELEPPKNSSGALFAGPWDEGISHLRYDNAGNVLNGNVPLEGNGLITSVTHNPGRQPKQQFLQRRILATIMLKNSARYHGMPIEIDDQPLRTVSIDLAALKHKLSHRKYRDSFGLDPLALASWIPPIQKIPQKKHDRNTAMSNLKLGISQASCDEKTEVPDPIWRLDEIGDLVDDLRLVWHRDFAYVYTKLFAEHHHSNPDWPEWSKLIHKCKMHLRGRLWREAEHTALLLRRIPIDFPRLTRLTLYIPAALYPDHDQTFINHALPRTGWTVKHCCSVGGSPPCPKANEACLKLADDLCPFIRRVFTRPRPTADPSAVVVHNDEWHKTKRPIFDLDDEYKSMEQLLTGPLRENYTMGQD